MYRVLVLVLCLLIGDKQLCVAAGRAGGWWLGLDGLVTRSLRGQLIGQQPLESFKQTIHSLFSSSIILPPELTCAQRVAAGHSCGDHMAWCPCPGVWRRGRTGPGPPPPPWCPRTPTPRSAPRPRHTSPSTSTRGAGSNGICNNKLSEILWQKYF